MPERFQIDWGVGDVIREFGQLRDTLGSSTGTTGALSSFGGALGISDIRAAAEALHRASLSGLGQVTASRYGIPFRPLEVGTATDRGAMLIQALEGLRATARGPGGVGAALADARNLNLEDWIGVVHLMDDQFARIKQEAMATADMYSPERIANAVMLNNEMRTFNRHVSDLGVAIEGMFIPIANSVLGFINDRIREFRGGSAATPGGGSGLGSSMDSLRSSVDANTMQLRQMQGFYGAGPRARAALPAAFGLGIGRGQYIADNLRSLGKSLGTMPLSS